MALVRLIPVRERGDSIANGAESGGEVDGRRQEAYAGGGLEDDDEVAAHVTGDAGDIAGLSHGEQVERVVVSADGCLANARRGGSNTTTSMLGLEEPVSAVVVGMKRRVSEIDGPYDPLTHLLAWSASTRHFCARSALERERERWPFMLGGGS